MKMDLPPSKIDIGKLAYVFHLTAETDIDSFVRRKLQVQKTEMGLNLKMLFYMDLEG